jgi:hypothetical protein
VDGGADLPGHADLDGVLFGSVVLEVAAAAEGELS